MFFAAVLLSGKNFAAETKPVVGIGATREEVLTAYGWPNGQSQAADKEIFTYPQGQVVLKNGVVERMEFSPNVAWPKPKSRPRPASAGQQPATAGAPEILDVWFKDFGEASREALRRPAKILALFTATDWSPPSKRFQAEVALNPEFLNAVGSNYVLLRLDFPTHTPQPAQLRLQNAELRERYRVTTYPTLLILNPDGQEVSRVDLVKARSEPTYCGQIIAAVAEARPRQAALVSWVRENSGSARAASVERGFNYNPWLLGGAAAVLFFCWLIMRRNRLDEVPVAPAPAHTVPTPADIALWSQDRVRDVVKGLFEFEGSRVEVRPTESGAELALLHPGEARPRVLVRCQAAAAGLAGAKSVRNLFGTVVVERVDNAWYVSPGGFTPEARQFAGEHSIVLIGGEDLIQRMKSVPTLALMRMVTPPA